MRRRGEKDAELGELARQIAGLRRDLSHLANLPKPDAELPRENLNELQREKLNELEAKEIRLAQINGEFNRHLQAGRVGMYFMPTDFREVCGGHESCPP